MMSSVGKPYLRKWNPFIGLSGEYRSETAIATRFAEEPMMLPIPPTHAPRESAHDKGSTGMPRSPVFLKSARIYVKVVVYGKDSKNAEPMVLTQRTRITATSKREPWSTCLIVSASSSPTFLIRPSSAKHSTKMKRLAKNRRVSHSTAFKKLLIWWCDITMAMKKKPTKQNQAGLISWTGDVKRPRVMKKKMVTAYRNCRWSMIGWAFLILSRSISTLPLTWDLNLQKRMQAARGRITHITGPL
mmetsp:Transcript_44538/g.105545  ORF Transcript_44538/g.105545 Transcript_44538/m.105545 type:complete len:244 (-) Transcript_44538:1665-2396(-)